MALFAGAWFLVNFCCSGIGVGGLGRIYKKSVADGCSPRTP